MLRSDSTQPWAKKLLGSMRRNVSPYVYATEISSSRLSVGLMIQDVITDQGNDEATIKFIPLDSIGTYERTSRKTRGPSKREFTKRAKDRYASIIYGSQTALLPSLYMKLVRVPEVSLSMTPLRKILRYIEDEGAMRFQQLEEIYPPEKSQKYLTLLSDLDYVALEDGAYVPGKEMSRLHAANVEPPVLFESILADVIQQRPKYLQDVLHWTMMVPYLRWSNAYYLPAYEAGKAIKLDRVDLIGNYRRFYRVKSNILSEVNQISNIVDSEALHRESGFYVGDEEILQRFSQEAEKVASLEPLRVASG